MWIIIFKNFTYTSADRPDPIVEKHISQVRRITYVTKRIMIKQQIIQVPMTSISWDYVTTT
jgi:hypothetical protein